VSLTVQEILQVSLNRYTVNMQCVFKMKYKMNAIYWNSSYSFMSVHREHVDKKMRKVESAIGKQEKEITVLKSNSLM